MEKLQENNPAMDEAVEHAGLESQVIPLSVGQCLREAREQQGLTIEDVVNKIKLAPRQVEALEADDFEHLPELAFVRGFVRSYAKLLQLDAQPLLDGLPGAKVVNKADDPLHVEAPFPTSRSLRQPSVNLLMAAFILALLIAGFFWWQSSSSSVAVPPVVPQTSEFSPLSEPQTLTSEPQPDQVDAVASEQTLDEVPLPLPEKIETLLSSETPEIADKKIAVTGPVVPLVTTTDSAKAIVAPNAGKDELHLVFDQDSWVEVADQNGKTLSRQVQPSGGELRLHGSAPLSLVIGHASAVHLTFRGKPIDLLPYTHATSDVARLTLE